MKNGNVIKLNLLHLNSCHFNGTEKVQKGSAGGGSIVIPPPTEPDIPPTYTLSASVSNGKVSATRNGSAVNLPYTANEGDVIVLEVTPNDGYAFEGWNDGNTDNPRTITMNADVALSAQCVEVVQPPVGNYIQFEDAEVERVLMSKGVSSDGVGITMEDAAAVTSIEEWFNGNSAITTFNELQYFTGVTRLYYAFRNCNSLKSVRLSPNTTIIGERAFTNTTSLNSINLDKVTTIDYAAFYGTPSLRIKLNCPSLSSIGVAAFYGSGLEEIESLGNALTISSSEGGSNYGVFADCPNLKIANISRVERIGSKAFRYSPLETIDISSSQVINDRAFAYCDLQRVEIGKDVTSIAEYALYENPLKEVIVRATTPPSLGGNVFANTASTLVIYVPDASLEAYKGATNWVSFADRIHPLSEIEGGHITTFEGLIGAYTFEGRSNEDADRDIVEDKSGYNNTLTLKSMQWGFIDSGHPDLVREGLWDDALWLSQGGYGEITLPNGLTDFTIIAKRFVFAAGAGGNWSPLVGTGKSSGKGLFWLEYNAGDGIYTTQVNGLKYTLPSLESEVTWLTNTHYNGHRLIGTQGNDVHDGMVYINKFRGDVNGVRFQKIYAVYLFNRQLSPSEIEAFIKEKIDASYVLPTIEQ